MSELISLMRAVFLCALFAFGLVPQGGEAHSASATSTALAEIHAVTGNDHGEDQSVIEEAFGHCYPGIDCAPEAFSADPIRALRVNRAASERLRHFAIASDGNGPAFELPPPRSFT